MGVRGLVDGHVIESPNGEQSSTRRLLEAAAERAVRYLEGLPDRAVAPDWDAVARMSVLDTPMPDQGLASEEIIRRLDELGSPATMAMAGPRFYGFVIGGSLPAALAANWLASAWDQNSGLYNGTPATSTLEQIALQWLLDVLGLPAEAAGAFVTGTTVAHITALAAARHAVLRNVGWNVEGDGLFGAPPVTVVVGEECHPTLLKALGVVGLGRKRVVRVPVDGQGRMRADLLPAISGPTIVCVQVGNVNTGAFDPVREIIDAAHDAGAWVHVDGAFGLWARVAPSLAHLVDGVELADSWATDGHKWLNVPYDSGIAFVRDHDALMSAMAVSADYLPTETEHRNPSDYTPELSRRGRGVDVWAALASLGRAGLAEMVERHCRQARRLAEALASAGYEILNDVVLNQVLVSFGDTDTTNRVITGIQRDGTCWCGGTVWQGRVAMRVSIINWSTTDEDIEESIAAIVRVAAQEGASRR